MHSTTAVTAELGKYKEVRRRETKQIARCWHAGADQNRYSVAFTSYLATSTSQAAEAFQPLQWRTRNTNFDDPESSQVRFALPDVFSCYRLVH